jgi:MFS family permease
MNNTNLINARQLAANAFLPSRNRAVYSLGVLLLGYIFSIMDRQVLTLLIGPIQQSLHINDSWMGILHGFTFALFYSIVGLPIARLIDRGNRRLIISVGVGLWCLATAASGLATEFWHLLLARACVAVGEAVLLPGAVSLISEFFTPEKRGRALGALGTAGPLGAGIGLLSTGLVLGYFTTHPLTLPLVGQLEAWQLTLMCIGLPGLVVLALMQWVPEPRQNRKPLAKNEVDSLSIPITEVGAYLRANKRSFTGIILGAGCFYAATYGGSSWLPTYFVREFGWSYTRIGTWMGLILCVCSPIGVMAASWLGEYWRNRGIVNGNLRVAIIVCAALLVVSPPLLLSNSPNIALPFVALLATLWFCLLGIGPALIIELSPVPMRGQFIALFTGALNFIGAGIGPVSVGLLTDYVLGDPADIKYAILIVTLVSSGLGCVLFMSARKSFAATARYAQQWQANSSC